jgi:protein STE50
MIDIETLKSIGVSTVGQRLSILKAIYQLKLAQNIPLEADDYVPPCKLFLFLLPFTHRVVAEVHDRAENSLSLEKLNSIIQDQGQYHILRDCRMMSFFVDQRLRALEEENRSLNNTIQTFLDDYNNLRASLGLSVRLSGIL